MYSIYLLSPACSKVSEARLMVDLVQVGMPNLPMSVQVSTSVPAQLSVTTSVFPAV